MRIYFRLIDENDNITKQKYDTGLNIGFKFEEDLDYPVYDLRS